MAAQQRSQRREFGFENRCYRKQTRRGLATVVPFPGLYANGIPRSDHGIHIEPAVTRERVDMRLRQMWLR
jgi:hypothetical protein